MSYACSPSDSNDKGKYNSKNMVNWISLNQEVQLSSPWSASILK